MLNSPLFPRVTLVGAGPGDPELISLKGIRALQNADVILYDALVCPSLLDYAPAKAEILFVGKRAGKHPFTQTEINRLIVSMAHAHGHLVRLKGGDPFVFGRGHEELSYARAFGLDTQLVPGISSVAAVPGLQQIPLTKRGINESFWVITGTTSKGEISRDMYQAARSKATVVVLMGLRKLAEIMRVFHYHGQANTPVAVIESGSTRQERIVLGTVESIADNVNEAALSGPGLIVIGQVVRLHPQFTHRMVQEYGNTQWVSQ